MTDYVERAARVIAEDGWDVLFDSERIAMATDKQFRDAVLQRVATKPPTGASGSELPVPPACLPRAHPLRKSDSPKKGISRYRWAAESIHRPHRSPPSGLPAPLKRRSRTPFSFPNYRS